MRKFLSSIVGVLALLSATGFAGEPTAELAPKDAIRLIAMKSGVQENAVEIPFIIDGSAKCGEGFEVKHVRRVAAIHSVRDGASQSRRFVDYHFFWNESLGWFMRETRSERA